MEQAHQTGNLRDYLTALFKNKYKVLAVFSFVVLAAALAAFLLPPVYQAKSSLLVKFGREHVNLSEAGTAIQPLISLNQEEALVNSEIQILTKRDLFEKVITTIKLEKIYPDLVENPPWNMKPMDAAIIRFGKKLTVEGVRKSNVVEVSFKHNDPRIAAAALNLLVDFFREKHLLVFSTPHSSFLEKQLSAYQQKLKESEDKLEAFRQNNRIFSFDEQRSILLRQRGETDNSFKNAQANVYELRKRLSFLKDQIKSISENNVLYTQTERDKIIVDAKSRLLGLQIEEQERLKKYKENSRLVVGIRKEIQFVKEFLKEQEEDTSRRVRTGNPVYQDVERELIRTEADLGAQNAKTAMLREQLSQIDMDIRSLDKRENEFQSLTREVSINDKNYRTYVDRTEEARITDDMNRQKMSNISIVQAASVPVEPVRPKKALYLFLGVVFGAISGLGFAFLSEYVSPGFSIPEHIEKRLGLPVLATIPCKKRYM